MGDNLNILSLDGGGIRGLSSLYVLRRLMQEIDPISPPKPCEVFDLIGGTSTGGLIAVMLGRLHLSVDDCIKHYLALSQRVFAKPQENEITHMIRVFLETPKFNCSELETAIKDVIRDSGYEENTLLKDAPTARCKIFVCAVSRENRSMVPLTSYPPTRGQTDLFEELRIWEACRATSAACTFFDPIKVGSCGRVFVDGGLAANNPIDVVWREAMNLWGEDEEKGLEERLGCLVSIGTGVAGSRSIGASPLSLVAALTDMATETEKTAVRWESNKRHLQRDNKYFRWNAPDVGDVGLDESDRVNQLSAETDQYLSRERVHQEVKASAHQLRNETVIGPSEARRARHLCEEVADLGPKFRLARNTVEAFFHALQHGEKPSPQQGREIAHTAAELQTNVRKAEKYAKQLRQSHENILRQILEKEALLRTEAETAHCELKRRKTELKNLAREVDRASVSAEKKTKELQELLARAEKLLGGVHHAADGASFAGLGVPAVGGAALVVTVVAYRVLWKVLGQK
ncbi:acyl transferase/acyl hydrolase/lysophospholipase [Cercophora scortea]|uniref:Acyl transferase/acyl hydrolase/lysophospholipase n=1 Tax=Cercophora scortea TaxID=314031 RepID=A0AAE0M552_9PEZI|nr:acyl transferase/acyl hydrolase/lysophospholipase [Cercophora scortea]